MFNISSGQIEMMTELSFKYNQAVVIGEGKGVRTPNQLQVPTPTFLLTAITQIWSRVHIHDLSNLYFLLTSAIIEFTKWDVPHGKTGYYFAENGYQTWLDISEGIGKIGKAQGAFGTEGVKSIGLQEAADYWYEGNTREAESVLASK
jgi:hypothetical protein